MAWGLPVGFLTAEHSRSTFKDRNPTGGRQNESQTK
jgi:hypothetical protein